MFFEVYLFALVLGGVLLLASMVGGDHDSDAGDVDAGGDADADGGLDHGADDGPAHGDVAGIATLFLSLRFWSFFAAFFGLTGVVFHSLELASPVVSLVLSIGTGAVCGLGAAYTIRALTRGEVGTVPGASDFVGQTGRVLLPVGGDGPGKVRLELQGTTVDVLAVTDDAEPLAVGDTALVVEMQDTTASVTRMSNGGKGS